MYFLTRCAEFRNIPGSGLGAVRRAGMTTVLREAMARRARRVLHKYLGSAEIIARNK